MEQNIYDAWNSGFRNLLAVMPTGTGKTKLFCWIAKQMAVIPTQGALPTAIMVHRKELLSQISLTLAEEGIVHNIIAPRPVIREIIAEQRRKLGQSFYNYQSTVTVVSVDTLGSREKIHAAWCKTIKLWITDEATHVLKENKWGYALAMFPNALGLGVTATPQRLDKRGLGSHADGVFDKMIVGPTSKWAIAQGYLCNYKIAIARGDYEHYLKKASSGADYSAKIRNEASSKSHIVGDVVKSYKKHADGKQCILFADSILTGEKMEKEFNDAGYKAKLLHGNTLPKDRRDSLLYFARRQINILINVDLFDEGLDVPGIEVVSLARPTMSVGKFLQMVGRGLRPVYAPGYDLSTVEGRLAAIAASEKPHLILIDHVGNVLSAGDGPSHGLPCEIREWTLDRIVKRHDKTNLMRLCSNPDCASPYDRTLTECPWCGEEALKAHVRKPNEDLASAMKMVDGDLDLLDPQTIRELQGMSQLEQPADVQARVGAAAGAAAGIKAMRDQMARIETQKILVQRIAKWAGMWKQWQHSDRQINKRFYLEFNTSITAALSGKKKEMEILMEEIECSTRHL